MDKLSKLEEILKQTNSSTNFDIVADLKDMHYYVSILKPKDFKKKLLALIEKYETSELTYIRDSLLNECGKGNVNAMRLYSEKFAPAGKLEEDDGLIDALMESGKGVFDKK